MRRWHFIVESILLLITAAFGIQAFLSVDPLGFAAWLLILGITQVIHSFFIVALHSNNNTILKWVSIYWIGVVVDFILLSITPDLEETRHDIFKLAALPVIPLLLAIYLWYICFHFRRKIKQDNYEQ
jgi:hypothetical protein